MFLGRPICDFTREPSFGFLLKWHKTNHRTLFSQAILLFINFYSDAH